MTLITGWRNRKPEAKTGLGAKRDTSLITPDTLERRLPPNGVVNSFTAPAPGHDALPARLMGRSKTK